MERQPNIERREGESFGSMMVRYRKYIEKHSIMPEIRETLAYESKQAEQRRRFILAARRKSRALARQSQ